MSFYDPQFESSSKSHNVNKVNKHKQVANRFISQNNDKLYLGWVFLRSNIFKQLSTDVHHFCYRYVDEPQLIINLQNLANDGESLSDFFYALITSSLMMVQLQSVTYKNNKYSPINIGYKKNMEYPKDPESVQYNIVCDANKFHWGGVSMIYHKRINNINDDMIKMCNFIDKFLKQQNNNKQCSSMRLLQNIILNIGKDWSLFIVNSNDSNNEIEYNTECDIPLYVFESVVWKNRFTLYDLLKGIIQLKSKKWKCDDSETIEMSSHFIDHQSKQFIIYVGLNTPTQDTINF
eukprot:281238_1